MSVSPASELVRSIASVRPARTAMAISPDGRQIAFAATKGPVTQLFLRSLDRSEATPVPGTEGGAAPFFSPDGGWIGFRVGNSFRKVPVAGGAPVTIAEVDGGSASWGENDTIFLAGADGISSVSSNGGPITAVTRRDVTKRERHILPHALPGGKAILFTMLTSGWDTASVVLQVLGNGERRVLVEGGADGRFISSGHIAYMKSGTLMTVPFDLGALRVTGTPVAVIEGVMQAINAPNSADETGAGQFAVSASGTLLYATGGVGRPLESTWVWVDRKGAEQPLNAIPAGPYLYPRLSPDGQKIAVTVRRGPPDLWVYDATRGAPTRLTFDGGTGPIWSPDGKRVAYAVTKDGVNSLHVVNADGSGRPEQLAPGPFSQIPSSWSAATNEVAFLQRPQLESYGIWIMPMDGGQGARKPRLFLESRFTLSHPEFSPDGRWMAYVSRESGGPEVYVQPYPGPGEKIRISTTGGIEPIWTATAREILYRDDRQVFSATIRSLSPFRVDPPRVLFATKGQYDSTSPLRSWNVSADGERFLFSRFAESPDKPVTAIDVVLNWSEGLKR
jgi:serine/threonine-protein kinase